VETPPAAPTLDLFVLAHHDDEVFCAGHLRRALAGGGRVRLLWATAGGLAPARRRVAEGARVLATLGLPAATGNDLHLRDQHAVEHVAAIAAAVTHVLVDEGRGEDAATVYVPAYEGGHPDHDAVNLAAALAAAARPGVRVVEFPLYRRGPFGMTVTSPLPAPGTAPDRFAVLPLDERDLALRWLLARANASQLVPSVLPLPAHDYTRPPHPGRLLYELYTPWRFARWSAAAAASSVASAG
jgi:N-acetylglucosamine malate deacetylase 2